MTARHAIMATVAVLSVMLLLSMRTDSVEPQASPAQAAPRPSSWTSWGASPAPPPAPPAWTPYARSDQCALDWACPPNSAEAEAELAAEVAAYELDVRFKRKIAESKGRRKPDARQPAILKFLREKLLRKDMSVLDLGCAAGNVLRNVRMELEALGGHGAMAGVDLVCGWIKAATEILPGIHFQCGDVTVTRVMLPAGGAAPSTFDLVMMNDALEHIQTHRYGCLFDTLARHTHPGSYVYLHVPTPETQFSEQRRVAAGGKAQYYENLVPHDIVVRGLACYGFQLRHFELDSDTVDQNGVVYKVGGIPKYAHLVFHRPAEQALLGNPSESYCSQNN